MWIFDSMRNFFLAVIGLSAGFAVAGGVFTVFTAVGLVPRFADKIEGANHILLFENMIIIGVFLGIFISVYEPLAYKLSDGLQNVVANASVLLQKIVSVGQQIIVGGYALLTGCYISCLSLSIAEIFDVIPIMARRTGLRKGIGMVILSFAIGKTIGSLFYYGKGFFR